MSNTTTEQMLQIVQSVKDQARHAEQEYEAKAEKLQQKSERNINLFGGTALEQVRDIARESRAICDSLYAAYQAMVRLTDERCRPLLENEPDLQAVRAVRDLIAWLNAESEITNSFTASLNSRDLGDLVDVQYIPTKENKVIQSYWDNQYSIWPGREETEQLEREKVARERVEAAEQRREAHAAAVSKKISEQEQYELNLEAWKNSVIKIKALRKQELDEAYGKEEEALRSEIQTAFEEKIRKGQEKIERYNQTLLNSQERLASLGFFKVGEKKECRKLIKELSEKVAAADTTINEIKRTYEQDIRDISAKLKSKREKLRREINERYKLPEEPCPPGVSPGQLANMRAQDAIVKTLRKQGMMKIEEIMEKCSAVRGMTQQRVNMLLRQDDRIFRQEIKRMTFFDAVPETEEKNIAKEKENNKKRVYDCLKRCGPCVISQLAGCSEVSHLTGQQIFSFVQELYREGKVHRSEKDEKAYFEAV